MRRKSMDERRVSKAVVMSCFLMVMMIVGGNCSPLSEFEQCYVGSFILCIILPTNTAYGCSLKSLKDCIPSSPSEETLGVAEGADAVMKKKGTDYFCRLGCASSLCTNISTEHNPGKFTLLNIHYC